MKQCEDCGKPIEDRYKLCQECNLKRRQEYSKEENKDTLKSLSAINNNLYAIRRLLEKQVEKQYNERLEWDKNKKDFVFRGI